MNREWKEKRMKMLVKKILAAKKAYYTTDTPLMSDADYDALEMQLEALDKNHPVILMVGYEIKEKK